LGADVAAGVSHKWLAQRLEEAKIGFEQTKNAFRRCGDAEAMQRLDDGVPGLDDQAKSSSRREAATDSDRDD